MCHLSRARAENAADVAGRGPDHAMVSELSPSSRKVCAPQGSRLRHGIHTATKPNRTWNALDEGVSHPTPHQLFYVPQMTGKQAGSNFVSLEKLTTNSRDRYWRSLEELAGTPEFED